MAKLTLKPGVHPRIQAAYAKREALQKWSDGKLSAAERDRVTSKANEKLRT